MHSLFISAEYCPVVSVAYSAHLARRDRDWIALHPLAEVRKIPPKLFTLMATAFVDMLGLLMILPLLPSM